MVEVTAGQEAEFALQQEAAAIARAELRGEDPSASAPSGVSYPSPTAPEVSELLQAGLAETVSEAQAIAGFQAAGYYMMSTPEGETIAVKGVETVPFTEPTQLQQAQRYFAGEAYQPFQRVFKVAGDVQQTLSAIGQQAVQQPEYIIPPSYAGGTTAEMAYGYIGGARVPTRQLVAGERTFVPQPAFQQFQPVVQQFVDVRENLLTTSVGIKDMLGFKPTRPTWVEIPADWTGTGEAAFYSPELSVMVGRETPEQLREAWRPTIDIFKGVGAGAVDIPFVFATAPLEAALWLAQPAKQFERSKEGLKTTAQFIRTDPAFFVSQIGTTALGAGYISSKVSGVVKPHIEGWIETQFPSWEDFSYPSEVTGKTKSVQRMRIGGREWFVEKGGFSVLDKGDDLIILDIVREGKMGEEVPSLISGWTVEVEAPAKFGDVEYTYREALGKFKPEVDIIKTDVFKQRGTYGVVKTSSLKDISIRDAWDIAKTGGGGTRTWIEIEKSLQTSSLQAFFDDVPTEQDVMKHEAIHIFRGEASESLVRELSRDLPDTIELKGIELQTEQVNVKTMFGRSTPVGEGGASIDYFTAFGKDIEAGYSFGLGGVKQVSDITTDIDISNIPPLKFLFDADELVLTTADLKTFSTGDRRFTVSKPTITATSLSKPITTGGGGARQIVRPSTDLGLSGFGSGMFGVPDMTKFDLTPAWAASASAWSKRTGAGVLEETTYIHKDVTDMVKAPAQQQRFKIGLRTTGRARTGIQAGLQTGITGAQTRIQTGLQTGLQTRLQTGLQTQLQIGMQTRAQARLRTGLQLGLGLRLREELITPPTLPKAKKFREFGRVRRTYRKKRKKKGKKRRRVSLLADPLSVTMAAGTLLKRGKRPIPLHIRSEKVKRKYFRATGGLRIPTARFRRKKKKGNRFY